MTESSTCCEFNFAFLLKKTPLSVLFAPLVTERAISAHAVYQKIGDFPSQVFFCCPISGLIKICKRV